jgi:hypothetical protein
MIIIKDRYKSFNTVCPSSMSELNDLTDLISNKEKVIINYIDSGYIEELNSNDNQFVSALYDYTYSLLMHENKDAEQPEVINIEMNEVSSFIVKEAFGMDTTNHWLYYINGEIKNSLEHFAEPKTTKDLQEFEEAYGIDYNLIKEKERR